MAGRTHDTTLRFRNRLHARRAEIPEDGASSEGARPELHAPWNQPTAFSVDQSPRGSLDKSLSSSTEKGPKSAQATSISA